MRGATHVLDLRAKAWLHVKERGALTEEPGWTRQKLEFVLGERDTLCAVSVASVQCYRWTKRCKSPDCYVFYFYRTDEDIDAVSSGFTSAEWHTETTALSFQPEQFLHAALAGTLTTAGFVLSLFTPWKKLQRELMCNTVQFYLGKVLVSQLERCRDASVCCRLLQSDCFWLLITSPAGV